MTENKKYDDGVGVEFPAELIQGANTPEDLYKAGLQYSTGQGVPMDYVCAHMLFNLAALMGSEDAKLTRKEISELMSSGEIAHAQKAAREWLEQNKTDKKPANGSDSSRAA